MVTTNIIEELILKDRRLGRHVEHDERSKAYGFVSQLAPKYKTVHHRHFGPVLDQGQIRSCTGNATAAAINTLPIHVARVRILAEPDALKIYELATVLDEFPGEYPPTDTGSSGLSAAKAAQQLGFIDKYSHAFNIDQALAAVQNRSVITGVNWYEGFDTPDVNGIVKIAGEVRGGHEFCVLGFELHHTISDSLVVAVNSWSKEWGLNGRFKFTVATWEQLLAEQGDVTILGA